VTGYRAGLNDVKDIAVFLCSRTGIIAEPWAAAGYECWCVDTQHSIRRERQEGLIHYVWGDCRCWVPPRGRRIAFVGIFTPCTHVAVSGARDFEAKGLRMLTDTLDLFNASVHAAEWCGAPYFAENPVGVISSHHRKPDFIFDPCDFAGYLDDPTPEAYTKKTCLWTGGGFIMPERKRVEPVLGSKMHLMPPSDDRADVRSVTPAGFAKAVFLANCKKAAVETAA
jgi:hypothetical protein